MQNSGQRKKQSGHGNYYRAPHKSERKEERVVLCCYIAAHYGEEGIVMMNKLGKAILLFGDPNGRHLTGMVIIEGHPGDCVWNLIPLPQNAERNQEAMQNSGEPYRRSAIGFRGR